MANFVVDSQSGHYNLDNLEKLSICHMMVVILVLSLPPNAYK